MADRNVFTVSFSNITVSAAQDLFQLTAPTGFRLEIVDVRFGQISDAGDAAAELLAVTIKRGGVAGSGGSAVTPVQTRAAGRIAGTTAARNNTTQSAGTTLISDVWNVMAPYLYRPGEAERITVEPGQIVAVGITAPADSLSMYGSITFAEVGI